MRFLALILSLILSAASGSCISLDPVHDSGSSSGEISALKSEERTSNSSGVGRDLYLSPTTPAAYSGTQGHGGTSLKTPSGARRTHHQTKSNFRFVKCGKVIEGNNPIPPSSGFLTVSLPAFSSAGNCLFTLCRLRL